MESAKSFLKNHDILERISFRDKLAHTVELGKDEEDTSKDQQGVEKEGVRFLVKEGGVAKSFFTTSISLIQKLAPMDAGDIVTIQMKFQKGDDGEYKSHYEVSGGTESDSIPIINEQGEYEGVPDILG